MVSYARAKSLARAGRLQPAIQSSSGVGPTPTVFHDLSGFRGVEALQYGLCVVGAGAAGLAVAMTLKGSRARVWISPTLTVVALAIRLGELLRQIQ